MNQIPRLNRRCLKKKNFIEIFEKNMTLHLSKRRLYVLLEFMQLSNVNRFEIRRNLKLLIDRLTPRQGDTMQEERRSYIINNGK